ncbi:MAG: 50S ribosomal protein L3 [Candidatus Omnitrophota bacterium]
MVKAIIGRKLRMTRMYTEDGRMVPLTAIEVGPCPIVQVKTVESDRYNAIQIGFLPAKEKKVTKAALGHFNKAKVAPLKHLREIRVDSVEGLEVGGNLDASQFAAGDRVDVSGISKGKGFQGGVRRHHWKGGRMTHGSMFHRRIGSVSPGTGLARVDRGHNLPGHMGHEKITIQNIEVMKVDAEHNILYIRGGVPGPDGGIVFVKTTTKTKKQKIKK